MIAFSFTLHPPTLSLDNQSLIGMCLGNETHASSGIDDLPEFCPVYSGSSCLKSECQKYIYKTQTGSVAEHTAAKLIEVQECCLRQCHKSHQVVTLKDLNKANGKNQVSGTAFKEIDKPVSENFETMLGGLSNFSCNYSPQWRGISGGYLRSCEAARKISTTIHLN